MKLPNRLAYDEYFYTAQAVEAAPSARAVLEAFCSTCSPRSVVDVGCGSGIWLDTFIKLGVTDVTGVDGPWARSNPLIPKGSFVEADLAKNFPALKRSFDAAISLEVGEHLPRDRSRDFVAYLTSLAPVVLFSAAIPGQGGANHVNERWQSEWAELFWEQGFVPNTELRLQLWPRADVDWWYRQNIVVYLKSDLKPKNIEFAALDVAHPDYVRKYLRIIGLINGVAALIPQRLKNLITPFLITKRAP